MASMSGGSVTVYVGSETVATVTGMFLSEGSRRAN